MAKKRDAIKDILGDVEALLGIKELTDADITSIPLEALTPYPKNPYRAYSPAQMEHMVNTIRTDGVLEPIIVRKLDEGTLQILAGHNRCEGARQAGLATVPGKILRDIDDETAERIVHVTNLVQRSLADMKISERARVVALSYKSFFSPGRRTDIQRELELLDGKMGAGKSRHSDEAVAEEHGLGPRSVSRLLRINSLAGPVKEHLDAGRLGVLAGVDLSYIGEKEQYFTALVLDENPEVNIPGKKAKQLRSLYNEGKLTPEKIIELLTGKRERDDGGEKEERGRMVMIPAEINRLYFDGKSSEEVSRIIVHALKLVYEGQE